MDVSWPPFFLLETAAERRNITRVVATIAYQMARAVPAGSHILKASLDSNPMNFHQSVDAQLAKFITESLRHLDPTSKTPYLLSSSTAWINIKVTTYNPGS